MKLSLVTLIGTKVDEEVYSVSIPTTDGEISVFPSHEPLVTIARDGVITIEAETQAALERAIKARDEAGDQVEREKAKQLIDRHMVRLKVADLHRRKQRR